MNALVKILVDDDGCAIDNPVWHLVDPANSAGAATLCTGEFFGAGESSVVYEEKQANRGGITCANCLKKLRIYKAAKL